MNDIYLLWGSTTSDQTLCAHIPVMLAVSLVITYDRVNLSERFLWICIGQHNTSK